MPTHADPLPFWQRKSLADLTPGEWESLCDGCGKCCLAKLQDPATGEVSYTNVACRLLDPDSCRCRRYARRQRSVENCTRLSAENVPHLSWLPSTCAYRLIARGAALPTWHPLVSGDPESVRRAGHSVQGRVVSEREAGPLEHHLVEWPA
jgi:uncharacterized cysteine cluster protein YcgN (CxxCxxCC family)